MCGINPKPHRIKVKVKKDALIGLPEAEAIKILEAADDPKAYRILERDGEEFIHTLEFSLSRINLYIKDGKVYKATRG